MYRRTQVGGWGLVVAGLLAVFAVATAIASQAPWPAAVLVTVLVPVALVFSLLTVEVTPAEVRFWFGGGFWRTRIALADIEEVEPVVNSWWWGWGIRWTPDGWLYNVSGLGAVRVKRKNGAVCRIGTDDPEALARAIRAAMARAGGGGLR